MIEVTPIFEQFNKYLGMYCSIDPGDETVPFGARDYFNRHGYLIVKNLYDPSELYNEVPKERGQFNYFESTELYNYIPVESQVEGSISRYSYPKYKQIRTNIRLILQDILGMELYNTYYYDRFYFAGQELKKHKDRDSCEISVSVQISKTSKESWPFCLTTLKGKDVSIPMNNGDGLIYMGCDVEHWRDPLKKSHSTFRRIKNKLLNKYDPDYHHQIFFHYVKANGFRSHYAFDRS